MMQKLMTGFLSTAVLGALVGCANTPPQPSPEDNEANRVRALMNAQVQSRTIETATAKFLQNSTFMATVSRVSKLSSQTCLLYQGQQTVTAPQELKDAYAKSLRAELHQGGETELGIVRRAENHNRAIEQIGENIGVVRAHCQLKYGT